MYKSSEPPSSFSRRTENKPDNRKRLIRDSVRFWSAPTWQCFPSASLRARKPKALRANAKKLCGVRRPGGAFNQRACERANQKGQPSRARRLAEQKHCQVSALQIDWCFHLGFGLRARRLAGRKRRRVVALQTPKKEKLQNLTSVTKHVHTPHREPTHKNRKRPALAGLHFSWHEPDRSSRWLWRDAVGGAWGVLGRPRIPRPREPC